MIPETKYKIAYFMIVMLLVLTILNMYLSIVYYIKLRNDPGIPGQQGPKGAKGAKGVPGKCSFSETCGIDDARTKILNVANEMYNIPMECLDNPSMETCKDQDVVDQVKPINAQINMLEKIAYSSKMSNNDFMNKIKVCIQDSNQCMDPTDF
jgi:hypothetical protein